MHTLLLPLLLLVPTVAHAQAVDDARVTPVVRAVQRAAPAVVTVKVEQNAASPFALFGAERRASEGSGVIIDPSGVVLTNAHVVDGADDITVHLQDGRAFRATMGAGDAALDLAVLRLQDAEGLPTMPLGTSAGLLLGEPAIAIGNPFGLGLTVSTGVVASTGRDVSVGRGPTQTYIQTDAAINPGNSGGALVNIHGELIGINTFIQRDANDIGFAIPVDRARKIASDLLNFGRVQMPWLAVGLTDVPRRELPTALADGAVLVRRAWPDAGLVPGDLVLAVDGHRVGTRAEVNARLAERRPGDRVELTVVRDRRERTVAVPTGDPPEDLGSRAIGRLGTRFRAVRGGLEVVAATPDGAWARGGLRVGDVLLGVDGVAVGSVDALAVRLGAAGAAHRDSAWFTVARGRTRGSLELRW